MHYCNIKDCDIANGKGVRVTLFVSGCTNHCKGCFQPETWDFEYGDPYTDEVEEKLIQMLSQDYINGLTLLGGEPFEPGNQRVLVSLLQRIRTELPGKDVWAYTGFTYEMLKTNGSYPRCEVTDEMLSLIDILVDGPFIEEQKELSLAFRGSRNQRILDLRSGEPVELHLDRH